MVECTRWYAMCQEHIRQTRQEELIMAVEAKEPATVKVEEAAKILGIGRQTAYELAREGRLPGALRLGRRIVVSRSQLQAFLDGKADADS